MCFEDFSKNLKIFQLSNRKKFKYSLIPRKAVLLEREIGEKGQVVIPKDIRRHMGIQKGSRIFFEVKGKEVILRTEDPREFIDSFLRVPTPKKKVSIQELKKEMMGQYGEE